MSGATFKGSWATTVCAARTEIRAAERTQLTSLEPLMNLLLAGEYLLLRHSLGGPRCMPQRNRLTI